MSGDLAEALAVPYERVPLFFTIGKVNEIFRSALLIAYHLCPVHVFNDQIGDALIIDPTAHELQCVESQLVVAVDRRNLCCGLQKIMGGTITLEETATAIQVGLF